MYSAALLQKLTVKVNTPKGGESVNFHFPPFREGQKLTQKLTVNFAITPYRCNSYTIRPVEKLTRKLTVNSWIGRIQKLTAKLTGFGRVLTFRTFVRITAA